MSESDKNTNEKNNKDKDSAGHGLIGCKDIEKRFMYFRSFKTSYIRLKWTSTIN
jgi:hypothetical protein